MIVVDGGSFMMVALNSPLVSSAYFSLFLLIDMTIVQRPFASFETRPACSEMMGKK